MRFLGFAFYLLLFWTADQQISLSARFVVIFLRFSQQNENA
jgi:hypothetical protein